MALRVVSAGRRYHGALVHVSLGHFTLLQVLPRLCGARPKLRGMGLGGDEKSRNDEESTGALGGIYMRRRFAALRGVSVDTRCHCAGARWLSRLLPRRFGDPYMRYRFLNKG